MSSGSQVQVSGMRTVEGLGFRGNWGPLFVHALALLRAEDVPRFGVRSFFKASKKCRLLWALGASFQFVGFSSCLWPSLKLLGLRLLRALSALGRGKDSE